MDVICVVQARMGSTRLPGKVLADVASRPLLLHLVDRVRDAGWPVVVATSVETADDAVADVATEHGHDVVRGPEADVLGRYAQALDRYPADVVVRLTADCPLLDVSVIGRCVDKLAGGDYAYVSNTLIRTYPDGLDVEAVAASALADAAAEAMDAVEREHVTPFIYRRPERFRLGAVLHDRYLAHVRLTVDEPPDLEAVRMHANALRGREVSVDVLEEVVGFPPIPAGRHLRPALPSDGVRIVDDPSDRTFIRLVDREPVGHVLTRIRAATATVSYEPPPEEHAAWHDLVCAALGAQVTGLKFV